MIPGVVEAVAGAVVSGAFAWAAIEARLGRSRTHEKLDKIDLILRGDGNGNPGIAERVRDVQQEVRATRRELKDHADGEEARIVSTFVRMKDELCGDTEEEDDDQSDDA